ncbi:MAG: hypothetical protein DI629_19000 [Mesorhizobium amorphae]|nr:MAG: hypothetical protein DI629_19000 [Mesorhizobium amorphae]
MALGDGLFDGSAIANLKARLAKRKAASADASDGSPAGQDVALKPLPVGGAVGVYSGLGVIQVGKRSYAVNMEWRPRNTNSAQARAATIPLTRGVEAWDLFVDNPASSDSGFGSTSLGHEKGMAPLSLAIDREIVGPSWLLWARIGSGEKARHWICAMDAQGRVVQDLMVPSADAAASSFRNEALTHDFARLIVPPGVEYQGAENAELGALLQAKPKAALAYMTFLKNHGKKLIYAALLISVASGAYYYKSMRDAEQARIEAEMLERQRERSRVIPSDYPWFDGIRLGGFVSACVDGFEKVSVFAAGWDAQPFVCSLDRTKMTVGTVYSRTPAGRIGWLERAVARNDGATAVSLDLSGNMAETFRKATLSGDEDYFSHAPWEKGVAPHVLRRRFQNLGLELRIDAEVETPKGEVQRPVFNRHVLTIESPAPLTSDILALLDDVPALVPDSLTWLRADNVWTLSVSVYEPPVLPEARQ